MEEAFLAALLSVGPNADNEVRLIQVIIPQENNGQVISQNIYVPSITATDTKVSNPQIVRIVNRKQ